LRTAVSEELRITRDAINALQAKTVTADD